MRVRYQKSRKAEHAFTLVELLIVIVVIAILSAIAINVYGNIQRQARNAARIESARQHEKALYGLVATGQSIPQFWGANPVASTCLSGDLPDVNGDGRGDCIVAGGVPGWSTDQEMLDAIDTVLSKPLSGYPEIDFAGDAVYGPYLTYATGVAVDGQPLPFMLTFFLEGGYQDCSVKPLRPVGETAYTLAHSDKYSISTNDVTVCYMGLQGIESP